MGIMSQREVAGADPETCCGNHEDTIMKRLCGMLLAVAVLLSGGCLRRTEIIVVSPDGSAKLLAKFHGDRDDAENGDPMPSERGGWEVSDKVKKSKDGEEEFERRAVRTIKQGDPFPSTYASGSDEFREAALAFPTSVTIEHRRDGTYYHFKRVYRARKAARIQHLKKQVFENDEIEAITDKEPGELTGNERKELAKAFIKLEAHKTRYFIDEAGEGLAGALPQDAWLPIRGKVQRLFDADDLLDQIVEVMKQEDADDEAAAVEKRLLAEVVKVIESTLADKMVPDAQVQQFTQAYKLAREKFEITEDLSDESWQVFVELPGTIVAHNCDDLALAPLGAHNLALPSDCTVTEMSIKVEVTDSQEKKDTPEPGAGNERALSERMAWVIASEKLFEDMDEGSYSASANRCGWTFDGDALQDHDIILMATSFVPSDAGE